MSEMLLADVAHYKHIEMVAAGAAVFAAALLMGLLLARKLLNGEQRKSRSVIGAVALALVLTSVGYPVKAAEPADFTEEEDFSEERDASAPADDEEDLAEERDVPPLADDEEDLAEEGGAQEHEDEESDVTGEEDRIEQGSNPGEMIFHGPVQTVVASSVKRLRIERKVRKPGTEEDSLQEAADAAVCEIDLQDMNEADDSFSEFGIQYLSSGEQGHLFLFDRADNAEIHYTLTVSAENDGSEETVWIMFSETVAQGAETNGIEDVGQKNAETDEDPDELEAVETSEENITEEYEDKEENTEPFEECPEENEHEELKEVQIVRFCICPDPERPEGKPEEGENPEEKGNVQEEKAVDETENQETETRETENANPEEGTEDGADPFEENTIEMPEPDPETKNKDAEEINTGETDNQEEPSPSMPELIIDEKADQEKPENIPAEEEPEPGNDTGEEEPEPENNTAEELPEQTNDQAVDFWQEDVPAEGNASFPVKSDEPAAENEPSVSEESETAQAVKTFEKAEKLRTIKKNNTAVQSADPPRLTLVRNGQMIPLEYGRDYQVVRTSMNGQWVADYEIDESIMEQDGKYIVKVYPQSEENVRINRQQGDRLEMLRDTETPNIIVTGLNPDIIASADQPFTVTLRDNIDLSYFTIYSDDMVYKQYQYSEKGWINKETDSDLLVSDGGSVRPELIHDGKSHTYRFEAADSSGNTAVSEQYTFLADETQSEKNRKSSILWFILACAAAAVIITLLFAYNNARERS